MLKLKKTFPFLIIAVAVIVLYLPILLNPSLVLARGNDLQEFFWPIFFFVKQQIIQNGQLPLWNNLFFSGMPLLSDPQAPLFYPPNIIFLLLPIGTAFITSFILHTFLGGFGMFFLARTLGMKQFSSLFAAAVYICTPKLFGYLEAGHFGLVTSFAWLPFIFLTTIKLVKSPSVIWSIALALFLAATFYTHILTFLIVAVASVITIVISRIKSFPYLVLSGVITFGLTAIAFLPQLEWLPYTTRQLLTSTREVFPQWNGIKEFLMAVFWPWGIIENLDSEKWLPLGTLTIALGTLGFLSLKRRLKIMLLVVGLMIFLLALNNLSPIYSLLLTQDWFVMLRVTTRVWFITILLVVILATLGLEILSKNKRFKKMTLFIAVLALAETLALSWARITIPTPQISKFAPREVYEFLAKDKDKFRVYCTNRCLSQKDASIYGLELIEGYNTIQQINYYKQAWQLTGAYWNYYTLSIPPIGTYTFEKPQPDPIALGEFNTKYVISPYELTDKRFSLEKKFGEYLLYWNTLYLPRAYFQLDDQKPGNEVKILKYSPNHIKVDTSKHESSRLVLSETWSPWWNAYLNGKEKVNVQEKPNTLRLVNIKPDTNFVEFRYEPKSFLIGKYITLATLLFLLIYLVRLLDIVSIIKRSTPITKA